MVKSLYRLVNKLRQWGPVTGFGESRTQRGHLRHPRVVFLKAVNPNITVNRRRNVLALFQSFAEEAVAMGTPPKGLEQAFAAKMRISPSMWSQIKSSRPIGDRMARQIEQHGGKPAGWLDEEREAAGLSPAEQQFIALALQAWRMTNAAGRKELKMLLKGRLEKAT